MTTITTSPEFAYHRLCVIKARLKMESVGLQGRGGAMRPRMAKEFGLKPRAPYTDFIAEVQRRMDAMWAEKKAEEQDYYDRSNDYE